VGAPLVADEDEEDTTVEARDAIMRAIAELPVSLPSPVPESAAGKVASGRPPQGAPAGAGARGGARIPPPSGSAATDAEPEGRGERVAGVVEKPRIVLSWPAALVGALVGFILGAVFFGRHGPAAPPLEPAVVSAPPPVTTSAPAPARIVAAPPPPPAPALEAVPPAAAPSHSHRQKKVVKLDEVVLTTPDPPAQ
jgi:hypothetical protein